MVGVEEGREFRFRGDLYSQESTFRLVFNVISCSWYWCPRVGIRLAMLAVWHSG